VGSPNSETSFPSSSPLVERVAVAEEVGRVRPPRPKPTLVTVSPEAVESAPEIYSNRIPNVVERRMLKRHESILDMFTVFSHIIAVRFLLFLALIGAFVLALQAMDKQTNPAIIVLVSYCLLTLGPLVALEIRKAIRG
jgi:hypothetical protein